MGLIIIILCSTLVGVAFYCLKPINISKLIVKYREETGYVSNPSDIFGQTMRVRNQPTYKTLVSLNGKRVIPAVIKEIRSNGGSMALYVLLWELTGVRPNHPLSQEGFIKFDMAAEEKAWLRWAEKQGL